MKHKNSKIIKIQIKPKYGAPSYSTFDSPIEEKLSGHVFSNKVVVKAPAQWLEPFKFQKNNANSTRKNHQGAQNSTNAHHLGSLRNQTAISARFVLQKNESLLNQTNIYHNSIERTLTKLNQNFISVPDTMHQTSQTTPLSPSTNSKIVKPSNKLNINDYFSCEKNLTRLTVFYSSLDTLNCSETIRNSSLLKCFDELLERKLFDKLDKFYYLKLQPLLIPKEKTICTNKLHKNNFMNSTTTTTSSNGLSLTAEIGSPNDAKLETEKQKIARDLRRGT